MKTKLSAEILDTMSKNPSNWNGVLYFNKKDPRLMVPKRHPSMGWTLNFASPYAYLSLISIILIAVISKYLL